MGMKLVQKIFPVRQERTRAPRKPPFVMKRAIFAGRVATIPTVMTVSFVMGERFAIRTIFVNKALGRAAKKHPFVWRQRDDALNAW